MKFILKFIFSNRIVSKIAFSLLFTGTVNLYAQTEANTIGQTYYDFLAAFFVLTIILIFAGILYFGFGKTESEETAEKTTEPQAFNKSGWAKIKYLLTRSTPLENEKDVLLDHEYDGIRELDNRIPPWLNGILYFTIIFGVIYMLNYHVLSTGKLQAEEYEEEMQAAGEVKSELIKSGSVIDVNTVTKLTDAASLSEGESIFKTNCVACHRADAGGMVGPNLTDDYWIHGGGIKNIFNTISEGVPAKGMISWKAQLSPKQIQEVASYIISLHGSNPPNPKAPEGEKYTGE